MANEKHLQILKQGVDVWNEWRSQRRSVLECLDLSKADLRGANLEGARFGPYWWTDFSGGVKRTAEVVGVSFVEADFEDANLRGTDLYKAYLRRANLTGTTLDSANLGRTMLNGAILDGADLRKANLAGANLYKASLAGADIRGTNLESAKLSETNLEGALVGGSPFWMRDLHEGLPATIFVDVDLSQTRGLDRCRFDGPSTVDHRTILKSKNVPLIFWRGCGLPDQLIDYMPSLAGEAIHFFSCFISYSSRDEEFAERLHADLQNQGVRCWFAPHDLEIGAVTEEVIDREIRFRDKVVLILSEASVRSAWVSREVRMALKEEISGQRVLFPLRLDNAVMETTAQWAYDIKETRNIGDFTRWKEHDAYKATLDRVLRDLRAAS